jgi:GNAT superfamily N-acetyltransferase
VQVVDLKQSHLEEACELFVAGYRRQRETAPGLDERSGDAGNVLPMLRWCLDRHPGVAMFENRRMIAYMTGLYIDELLGVHRGAYCPEWANASIEEGSFALYRLMYQALGQKWVEDRCLTHAVNLLSCAREALDAFVWNGFGFTCIDAVRAVEPITGATPKGLRISEIRQQDVPAWFRLVDGHNRHLARSPAFRPYLQPQSTTDLSDMLESPGNVAWMAWHDTQAVGYMKVTPVEEGAAWIVNGDAKFAVNGAYVLPEYRGTGIARALLGAVMEWAAMEGFVRCSVDFEATNLEACQFWLKHFTPVCRSMVRRLDERVLKSI